jgi:predicted GNAT family acetyltransferase
VQIKKKAALMQLVATRIIVADDHQHQPIAMAEIRQKTSVSSCCQSPKILNAMGGKTISIG